MSDAMADMDGEPTEADRTPPTLLERSGKLLMGGGLIASVVAHLTLGGVVLFGSPRLFATVPEKSITVDIVTPTEFAQASKGGTDQSASEATPPQPQERPIPEVNTQQQARQPPNARPAPPPPPFAAATPPPPPRSAPAEEARPAETAAQPPEALPDPARIAEVLALAAPTKPDDTAPPSDNAARLSASEVAAFKVHLDKCWAKPSIASDSKPNVAVRIALGPDGRLHGRPEILAVSSASSVDGPALVQSVMRALTQCQPYNSLPAAKYKEWKVLDLNFSQDAISDVSSSRNNVTAGPKG